MSPFASLDFASSPPAHPVHDTHDYHTAVAGFAQPVPAFGDLEFSPHPLSPRLRCATAWFANGFGARVYRNDLNGGCEVTILDEAGAALRIAMIADLWKGLSPAQVTGVLRQIAVLPRVNGRADFVGA